MAKASPTIAPEEERFLSQEELAKRWSCSKDTIRGMQRSGKLKPYYVTKYPRYALSDITAYERDAKA